MQQPNKIADYLEAVRQQIRWKRAQSSVLEEISNHIIDQKNAFICDGLDEEAATEKAIIEMGDPIIVGEQLDRAHRPRPDWPLLVMTATMLILGLVILFFVGPGIPLGEWMFQNQIIWAGIATLMMFGTYFLDFTIIGKYPSVVFFALGAITLVSSVFARTSINTSVIYPLLLFPAVFAGVVYRMRNQGHRGLILCGMAFIIPLYLSMIMGNITLHFLLWTCCFIILTAAVNKGWFKVRKLYAALILAIQTAIVVCTPFFMSLMGKKYIWDKMQVMIINPSSAPQGFGDVSAVIQRLLSHSQFIGHGLPVGEYGDNAAIALGTAANTDFLLTHLIYRFGWIALIGVIVIFTAFIVRAIILCRRQKSVLGFLVSISIISTLSAQCIVYFCSNLGFYHLDPLSLPLFSYGGRALVTNMCLIGFLLSVFRTGNVVRDKAWGSVAKSSRFIQYDNGRVIIDLKFNSIK